MELDGVSKYNPAEVFGTPKASSGDMGKQEFLQLLTAQLQHQDPMNPQSDAEFVAQLATFSSLEQAIQQNSALETIQMSQNALVSSQATELVGKDIVATGDAMTLYYDGNSPEIGFGLANEARSVDVRIVDQAGNVVRSISLGPRNAGRQSLAWDGLDDDGNPLRAGVYKLALTAEDHDGRPLSVSTEVEGRVDKVTFENGYPELVVGDARVTPADVLEIRMPEEDADEGVPTDGESTVEEE